MSLKAPLEQRQKIYRSLCYVLSERIDQVGWDEFRPADWDLFAQMAEGEGVAPLMYWTFKRSNVETLNVPADVFAALKDSYYKTLAQNTLMYQELERILAALDEAGIEVIVLKGAALAATVYEDIGLRPMGDLDLLVRGQDFEKAERVVRSLGYGPARPELFPGINRKLAHETSLVGGPGGVITVELHWGLIAGDKDQRSPDMAHFWEQTEGWRTWDRAFVLSPLMTILYLSAHQMLQHGSDQVRFLWLYDIHRLTGCNSGYLDYDQLFQQAHKLHWSSALFAVLNGLREHFGMPVENGFFNKFVNLETEGEGNLIAKRQRFEQTRSEIILEKMAYLDFGSKIILILAKIFPNPDHMKWHYKPQPDWLWPAYYPHRWLDISSDIIRTGARFVRGLVAPNDRSNRFEEKENRF